MGANCLLSLESAQVKDKVAPVERVQPEAVKVEYLDGDLAAAHAFEEGADYLYII